MAEYIEREALIEKCKAIIQDKWNDKSAPVSWSHAYADFIEDIENQPAADVATVVHGRMKKSGEFTVERYQYKIVEEKCSVCEHYSIRFKHKSESNFCSHCGAKMCEED